MTLEERERLQRWWLEESGLTPRELREIAVGLASATPLSTLPLGTASRHDEKDDREQGEQGDENEQEPQERKHALRQ